MTRDELKAAARLEGACHRFPPPYRLMAVSLEEAEFLYALVRLLKPRVVLELGAGQGVSARFIAEALRANGAGELWSVEPDGEYRAATVTMLEGLDEYATVMPTLPYLDVSPDVVFIDSGYRVRDRDIAFWLDGHHKGLVLIHDANRAYDFNHVPGVLLPCPDGLWIGMTA